MADEGYWSKLEQTWPARAAKGLWEGLMLPGDVYQGNVSMWGDDGHTNPQVINRAADLAGAVTGGSYAAPAMKDAAGMGIRAYHGSPHDFDRFDLSKIGTGEGAQAYGHGLYFAENEGVARAYRDALQKTGFKSLTPEEDLATGLIKPALDAAFKEKGPEAAAQLLDKHIFNSRRFVERAPGQGEETTLAALEKLKANGDYAPVKTGRMYEVNINADPAHFLDWDKPLAGQSDVANRILQIPQVAKQEASQTAFLGPDKGLTGSSAYAAASGWRRGAELSPANPAATTEMLREAGIPGIKYLDQGSRGAGQGSSNYVVFNDKLIDILRKYGIAGTATPLAAGLGLTGNDQQQ